MIKNLKLFIILSLFCCLFLGLQSNVFAGYVPPMTIDDASSILEYFRSGDNYKFNWYQSTTNTAQDNLNLLTSLHANASELMNLWNIDITYAISQQQNLKDFEMEWQDIMFVGCGRSNKYYIRAFFNSRGYTGNSSLYSGNNFSTHQSGTQYYFGTYPNSKMMYYIDIIIDTSSITNGSIGTTTYKNAWRGDSLTNNQNAIIINGNDLTAEYCCSLGTNFPILYDGQTEYNFVTGIQQQQQTPVNGDISSSYGYYFYYSSSNPLQLNLRSNTSTTLDEWWYIGDDLTSSFNYYYFDNNNNKVSINDYLTLNTWRNSGDNGTFTQATISRTRYRQLPANKDFFLDILVNSGDIIVCNQWNSFVTYSSVINTGETGSISFSGDSGEVDLTGIESNLENLNNNLTNVPNLSGETISSGDITGALGFQLASDPYSNFWYDFVNGLSTALTTTTKSYVDIDFLGYTVRYDLSNIHNPLPADLKNFLSVCLNALVCFGLIKEVKKFINDIQKGSIITNTTANALEEDTYLVLF